jgi:hypothetical protein
MNTKNLIFTIFQKAFEIPGVTVDRDKFLRRVLSDLCSSEDLENVIAGNPTQYFDLKILDSVADSEINSTRKKVSAISAGTGLGSNPVLSVALAFGDMAQYMAFSMNIAQKLAYLYGYPDLRDDNGKITQKTLGMLVPMLGVMFGAKGSGAAMDVIAKELGRRALKKIPEDMMEKMLKNQMVKRIMQILGIKSSEKLPQKAGSKLVPFIGAPISWAFTYFTFAPACKKLKKVLHDESVYFKGAHTSAN